MKFGNSVEVVCRFCREKFFSQVPLTGRPGTCGDCEDGSYTCVYCDAILVPGPRLKELDIEFPEPGAVAAILNDAEAYHYETVHMGNEEEA